MGILPRIIGTAGHIDHGKSTLVRALTGVDPDRLPEERRRGITIDLGFAPVRLPGGIVAAFVDVPGHERFVRTMVAGATGMDAALLVVAADEGPMPQTREHLAILELLGVSTGVVALTKADLVEADWQPLVEEEVRTMLSSTPLGSAPVVWVSGTRGFGLDELRARLAEAVARAPVRDLEGPARLPVDRVFTLAGHGTIVTGTLAVGRIRRGATLYLEPGHREVRVRSLEVHGEGRDLAMAGERTAVNLTGVERAEVSRGNVLAAPGAVTVTRQVAADLSLLPGAVLRNGARVHVHLGTAETVGRVVLLQADSALGQPAGERVPEPCRIALKEALAVAIEDRAILRGGTPLLTLGGARILDTAGAPYRRHRPASLDALEAARVGGPKARLRRVLEAQDLLFGEVPELARRTGLPEGTVQEMFAALLASGEAVPGPDGGVVLASRWERLGARIRSLLEAYHREHPLRAGTSREEVRARAAPGLDGRRFSLAVDAFVQEGWLTVRRDLLALSDFSPEEDPGTRALLDRVEQRIRDLGLGGAFRVPASSAGKSETISGRGGSGSGVDEDAEDAAVSLLLRSGRLVRVGDLVIHPEALWQAEAALRSMLGESGAVTAGEFRDRLGVSRRVAVPLLDFFDQTRVTRRIGDRHEAWDAS